jgi:hypothetical protein
VNFLAFSQMSQLMSVMFSSYLFLFGWTSDEGNIEELLKTVLLHGKTVGEDIFQSFYTGLLEIDVPILKSVSITTDGGFSKKIVNSSTQALHTFIRQNS